MENETDPKSEKSIWSAIKFATKAVKTLYLYVKSSKSYEHSGLKKIIDEETEKKRASWKITKN